MLPRTDGTFKNVHGGGGELLGVPGEKKGARVGLLGFWSHSALSFALGKCHPTEYFSSLPSPCHVCYISIKPFYFIFFKF